MRKDVKIIDDFCPDFGWLLQEAANATYTTIEHDGLSYRNIAATNATWAYPLFEVHLGSAERKSDFFRLYVQHGEQSTFIHSDIGIADFVAILSLVPKGRHNGSLAFWRHKKLGWSEPDPNDLKGVRQAERDGLIEDRWDMLEEIEMISNRCVIFPAPFYHSRYPLDWTKDHPRIVQIFFFDVRR